MNDDLLTKVVLAISSAVDRWTVVVPNLNFLLRHFVLEL